MKKLNANGFTHFEIALLILVVALIGFAGYTVWESNKPDEVLTNSTIEPAPLEPSQDTYEKPVGYVTYEDKNLGFKFDYPNQYGQFSKESIDPYLAEYYKNASIQKATSKIEVSAGISKDIRVWTYDDASTPIDSRKYGAKIQLKNNKWFVIEENVSDVNAQKNG